MLLVIFTNSLTILPTHTRQTGVNMSDRLYSKTKDVDEYWKEFIVKNNLVFLGQS